MLIVDFKSPDIVWAHRWLIARIETYKDTKIPAIKDITRGESTRAETEPFDSNIGSPQGDGMSGRMYDIYFKNALRSV